jgi:hypothetical protein
MSAMSVTGQSFGAEKSHIQANIQTENVDSSNIKWESYHKNEYAVSKKPPRPEGAAMKG